MNYRTLVALGFLVSVLAVTAWSQTGTSRITGTVEDSTGAGLSGAKVVVINEGTGVFGATTSGAAGGYSFESMAPGAYTIRVESPGFKTFVSTGNVLTIGQPMTVNAKLPVGAVNEKMEVVASAETVQTSTSGNFGNLVDQVAVSNLPIVDAKGRNPLDLVNFQPGVVVGANAGGGIHVHGARDRAWNYTLDGVDANETSAPGGGSSPIRPNPDMLAEFRVVTGNATADIGRASGGDVAMVTRSGTNSFHGNAFYFYQTPSFNANEVTNKISTPPLPRNQFVQHIGGFSLGGPIQKGKTFFFGNFQFLRTTQTAKVQRYVYTSQARQGLFRYVQVPSTCDQNVDDCPRNLPANTPGASVDLQGNVLPGVNVGTYDVAANDAGHLGLDTQMQDFLNRTPLPNDFTVGDGLNFAGFDWIPTEKEDQKSYLIKIDHTFNERHSVFVRWMSGHQNTPGDIVNAGQPAFPGSPNWVNTYRVPRNLAINWRWIPNSQMTNELVLGMNRFGFNFANGDPNVNQNPPFVPNILAQDPNGVLNSLPLHNDLGNARTLTTYQLSDNFSLAKGRHTLRWGGQFLYQRHIDNRGNVGTFDANPLVYFDTGTNPVDPPTFNIPTNVNDFDLGTAQGAINDLLGRVGAIDVGLVGRGNQWAPPSTFFNFDSRFPEYDLYFQDNWKIRPNLVIDAGIRWEIKMSPRNPHNLILHPDHPLITGSSPSDTISWVPGKLYNDSWKNFGPSVGIAWDPKGDGKTSIRANYRLAFDRINTFVVSSYIIQNLPGQTYSYENVTFGSNGGRLSDGLPPYTPDPSITPASLSTPPPFSTNYTTVMDPNLTTPRTHEWGLSIQHDLPAKLVLEVNYIGRHGSHLFGGYDANRHEIAKNGFLDAFKQLQANNFTGDSPLINQLLTNFSDRGSATGSQYIQDNFPTSLALNSIGPVAKFINQLTDGNGNQLIAAEGFSPFFFTPFPQFSDEVDTLDTHDWSNYHALEVQVQRRFTNGLQFQASYTYAKSLDTRSYDPTFSTVPTGSSQSSSSIPFDNVDRRLNYARSDFDRRHALQGNWVWDLPFGRGRQWLHPESSIVNHIIGGWQVAGIFTLQSGRPFTVYSGAYTYNDTVMTPASCDKCSPGMGHLNWQDGNGDPAPAFDGNASLYYFTPQQQSLFYQPAPGQLSNIGRNFFNLPHNFNVDMGVAKMFKITEHQNFEMRLDVQNLTNAVIYDTPVSSRIVSGSFGNMLGQTFNHARRMQLSGKYTF
jgi:Carboxypeptidase regulatory-like domain/TonB-dependent Receptor Plug Domain